LGALFSSLVIAPLLTGACSRDAGSAAPRDRQALEASLAEVDKLVEREDRTSVRQAKDLCLQAVELARELDEPLLEAQASQRLGRIYRKFLEQPREAIRHYQRAASLYEELGQSSDQCTVLINIAWLHSQLGEIDRALELYGRALPLAREIGDRYLEVSILNNQAIAARRLGEVQQALTLYDGVIEVLESLDRPKDLAEAHHNRARLYQAVGQYRQALADLDRSLAIARELKETRSLSRILTRIGQIRERQGDLEGALEALEEALALREETEQERGRAVTLLGLARVSEGLGRLEEAAELNREALAIARQKEARPEVARALTALGRLDTAAGRTDDALASLQEALALARELRDPAGEIEAAFTLARAERARDDPLAALQWSEEALDDLEALRSRAATQDLRRAFAAAHRDPYDFHVDLLMELHRREPGAGYDRRALEAAERSRAQSLVELLTRSPEGLRAGADPELLARERALEARLTFLERQRLDPDHAPDTPAEAATLESRLDETLRDLRALRGRIFAESPRYASLTRPRRFGVEEIQRRALDAQTLLLEYHLGPERSFLWAVTPDSVTSFLLPPRAKIDAAAREAHELLAKSHHRRLQAATRAALERLGHLVLDPVADALADKWTGQRLAIAADGALHFVPFAALPLPGSTTADRPLIAAHDVVHVPSASALLTLRELRVQRQGSEPGRTGESGLLAVIADPVFDADDPRLNGGAHRPPGDASEKASWEAGHLGRLRFSAVEAEAILRLAGTEPTFRALGFEATREAATDPALAGYRILHVSTHGRIDTERPELSQLVFSRFDPQGQPRNGSLLAHEIYDLDLPADLVVLSACETALGEEVRGEGLVGLTQGFLSAGAAGVLVSLWRVDDRATARLMERFYRRLLAGEDPASALRQAQLSLRRETDWQAPYYWAGWVLQGEWRALDR